MNLIEEVSNRPVRGATEHFFRTVALPEVKQDEWEALPTELRKVWIETALSFYLSDVAFSVNDGTLLAQDDCEIARTPMKVDEQGWQDIRDVYVKAQEQVMQIKAEAETRMTTVEESGPRRIVSFFSLIEMPPDNRQ